MNNIPIVYLMESSNIKLMSVSIISLLKNNIDKTIKYDIFILFKNKINQISIDKISNLQKKYNCSITFKEYTPSETLYDLYCDDSLNYLQILNDINKNLPSIDKCIFLDNSTIVQKNLKELFEINLVDNCAGLVPSTLDDSYELNVMLISLSNFRGNNNHKDVLSINIKYNLSASYFENQKSFKATNNVQISNNLMSKFPHEEVFNALDENYIFSYKNNLNPICQTNISFEDVWYKYYKLSPLYIEIDVDNIKKLITQTKKILKNPKNYSINEITKKYNLIEQSANTISKSFTTKETALIRKELGVILDELLQYKIDNINPPQIPQNLNVFTSKDVIVPDNLQSATWDNTQLMKGFGLIGYTLAEEIKATPHIMFCSNDKDYNYSKYLQKLKLIYADTNKFDSTTKIINTYLDYLNENYKKIDILVLNGLYPNNELLLNQYRELRPDGKVYCALDMNSGWKNKFFWDSFELQEFANKCDVISTVCTHVRDLLNADPNVNFTCRFFSNAFYNPEKIPANITPDKKENTILTVGRIGTEQKNNQELMLGFAKIADQIPDWKLKLVGNIDPLIEPFIKEFFEIYPHMKERVIFTGPIYDKNDLYEEYAKAKVFALTSSFEGGAPNVYAEALYHGCKFISSSFDASFDIVKNGELGFRYQLHNLEELSEKMVDLCSNYNDNNIENHFKKCTEYLNNYYEWSRNAKKLAYLLFK